MQNLQNVPDWLGGALIGGVLAALGYVAKLGIEQWRLIHAARAARLASLAELSSLLRAGRASFLTQNPGERLITSCGTVLDARTGNVLANVTNPSDGTAVSGDEIWYNPGDDRVYFGSNNVAVVDASTYDLVRMSGAAEYQGLGSATIDTNPYQVLTYFFPYPLPTSPPLGVTFGGHTLAANSSNNHIFVPVTGAGVKVFVKN